MSNAFVIELYFLFSVELTIIRLQAHILTRATQRIIPSPLPAYDGRCLTLVFNPPKWINPFYKAWDEFGFNTFC